MKYVIKPEVVFDLLKRDLADVGFAVDMTSEIFDRQAEIIERFRKIKEDFQPRLLKKLLKLMKSNLVKEFNKDITMPPMLHALTMYTDLMKSVCIIACPDFPQFKEAEIIVYGSDDPKVRNLVDRHLKMHRAFVDHVAASN